MYVFVWYVCMYVVHLPVMLSDLIVYTYTNMYMSKVLISMGQIGLTMVSVCANGNTS